jgi:hypothetical protein
MREIGNEQKTWEPCNPIFNYLDPKNDGSGENSRQINRDGEEKSEEEELPSV